MNEGKPPPGSSVAGPDNPECTAADFARARPAHRVLPPEAAQLLVRRRGRPAKADGTRKEAVSIRLSPEVLAYFRGTGEGWQTRIDELLRAHIAAAEPRRAP